VHRDVSPQNIMVGANGVARVLDFGIAKAESQNQSTRPGMVKGKFSYLSPEQVRGLPVDARTDVFSAAVVLWESLTGHRLFAVPGLAKTVERVLGAPIPAPSSKNPSISAELDRVVLRALQRESARRYESAAEFADALRRVSGEATRAEVSAWVSSTAAEGLARRLEALHELEVIDVAEADIPLLSEPASNWDDPTLVESLEAERSSARLLWESKSVSITSGGTTRSLTPRNSVAPRHRQVVGVGLALLVSLLTVIGFASSRRRVAAVAASSTRAAPSTPKRSLPPEPTQTAASAMPEPPIAFPSTSVAVPIVQLDELPSAPSAGQPRATGAKRVSVKRTHQARTVAAAVNCDLPYTIDASGVRRVRFECL
jgi:serine/threonine-protein kinase